MKLARSTFLRAALVVGILAFMAAGPCFGAERRVRFAVIGDRTGSHEPGIHGQILTEIDRLRPDFVIGVGDMIEGYTGDTDAIESEWQEYKALLEVLSVPIHQVPGNHDIWDEASLALYRKHMGEPLYSFDIEGIHFLVLDTSRWDDVESFPRDQLEWAKTDLERHRDADHTVAVFHKPYWIETIAAGKPDPLHDLFVAYGVDAVFTGHYHVYFSGEFDGILYTGIGSSGGGCDPGVTGLRYHFAWVTAGDDGISIAPIRMGAVLPWEEVTSDLFWLVRRVERGAVRMSRVEVGRDLFVPMTELEVSVSNLDTVNTMRGELAWDVPKGWNVMPRKLPVAIAPAHTHTERFTIENDGPMYPAPVLEVQYPYAEAKSFSVETPVPLVRSVYAYKVSRSPVIDGGIEGAEIWQDPTADFFAPDGGPVKTDPVEFYFAWDESSLYIAAECMDTDMDALTAAVTEHDGAVWGEDCVGFFLQPEVPDGPFYQIYFNAIGTVFDQKLVLDETGYADGDPDWNGTYEVKTAHASDRWTIEARIPLEQLGTKGSFEKVWALNFRRKQRRLNTAADWQVPIGYDPKEYGVLVMR
jgi:hypothetical protein